MELDIRLHGRNWESEEFCRHDELPGRLELIAGKRCGNDEERLLLFGALLEHVGTARVVQLGPLQAWQYAVAMRMEENS